MITKDDVMKALSDVFDPELGLNIVEMGLVYDVRIEDEGKKVHVDMTLTTPGCPLHQTLAYAARRAIEGLDGVEDAEVELVWSPPWSPDKMTEEAKRKIGYL